jgi:hypothetical protein
MATTIIDHETVNLSKKEMDKKIDDKFDRYSIRPLLSAEDLIEYERLKAESKAGYDTYEKALAASLDLAMLVSKYR